MNTRRDTAAILVLLLTVLALFAAPPAVAVSALVGGGFVGILAYLAVWASDSTQGAEVAAWRAAVVTTLTALAVLGLASWIGPGTVVALAIAGVVVMVRLGHVLLRPPTP